MYPHGARPALTPSVSHPRVMAMPVLPPVPLHVTSSRKVHRSADGIINIIQEISFYAEGGAKGLAGKQLKEVHSHPPGQERGRFSAETNARVFVGERLIRMHIQTAIRPNTSDSLEIDEVFHFAENNDAIVVPIAFEATLEREEGEKPAVEFDLSSLIIVTLKQRILKDPGEQYKVLQAIELRANDSDTRPTQELARKTTLTQPTSDSAQFRERIFAGTDVLRVDRDIIFVCDRPMLSLSERREYTPAYPVAPRRRSASLTQSAPRVKHTPNKPRSRSQSRTRSWTDSENCATANEDLPTATSPYSLYQDESNSRIPPYVPLPLGTARDHSPVSSNVDSSRTSRSKRKKWTVNSVVSKADARTPERYDRARTMRSLDTARNLSLSPLNRSSDYNLKTAHARSPNGEIPAIHAIPIVPTTELGPHGESQLVEGMELLKVAAPVDSLMRTCADGLSPRRSASNCSTAGEIPASASTSNYACQSPPFSSPRIMPQTAESSAPSTRACTPLRTARQESPRERAPSSAALDKRRGLFGYGIRPATSPMRSARSPAPKTAVEASPMRTAQRIVLSPMHTAVRVNTSRSNDKSHKSQKESKKSNRSEKREAAKARLMASDYRSSTNLNTARNLFVGTVASNESLARMITARTPTAHTGRDSALSPALATGRPQSIAVSPEKSEKEREQKCPHQSLPVPSISPSSTPLRIETWSQYDGSDSKFGKHGPTEPTSPYRSLERSEARTARSPANVLTARDVSPARAYPSHGLMTGAERSPARGLTTARDAQSPMGRRDPQPRMLFGDILTSPCGGVKTARPLANSPYEPAYERSAPNLYYSGEKIEDESKTARAHSHHDGIKTALSPAQTMNTAKYSPYERNVMTAREGPSPLQSMKTARQSPHEKTACDVSPARGLPTGRAHTDRSPSLVTGRPRSPYETRTAREARSPALNTAVLSPYEQKVFTAHSARSPMHSTKTGRDSDYEKTARMAERSPAQVKTAVARDASPYETTSRSPADGVRTAVSGRSPSIVTARKHSPTPRSLYLSPLMAKDNAAILEQQNEDDGSYTQVVTARAVSPYKLPQGIISPLRPSMTSRNDDVSTKTCVSGGVDTNARWTARSAKSPMMSTSRDISASPMRTARSGYAAPTTTPTHSHPHVMDELPNLMQPHELSTSPQQQNTAVYGGGAGELLATSRTQSPATRSSASNVMTAVGVRSPHVDTESPNNLATARSHRDRQIYGVARSPLNVRTAREARSTSRARTSMRTANSRTPEHNTMPDSHLRQEDSYSEQSQFTFQKTPSGYTQKPTHSNEVSTGQQRTPTKTDTGSVYYSARQTTPSRTIRPDDVTLTKRTPKRDFSQHGGLESSRSPLTRTAVGCTPKKQPKVEEMPKCSLKSGCQVTHTPRIIPAGPDSDKDSPTTRSAVAAKTPERSIHTARGLPATRLMTPKAPFHDMRTPRTARASKASPASSLLRSPAPSSHMITAISPDAASNSNNSNEDVVTARRPAAISPAPSTTRRNWAAATTEPPTVAAASKPRVIVRANQADGKIHVEVCLSFKLNTTGTIRVRGEMVPSLHPRTVSVNGQQIWSDSRH